MDKLVCQHFANSLSPTTTSSYCSGIMRHLSFSTQFTLAPFPLSDSTLCRFVAYLHSLNLTPCTISLYISSVCFGQIAYLGHDSDLISFSRLHYILQGVRCQETDSSRPCRLLITPTILKRLRHAWSQLSITYDQTMLWAACSLGFFGFLPSQGNSPVHMAMPVH